MFAWLRRLKLALEFIKANEERERVLAREKGSTPAATKIAGLRLVNGLRNREAICTRCFTEYKPKQREFADRFQLRSILQIPDSTPDPMLCDYCWAVTIESFNRFQSNVGTSNAGHSNIALRRLIAKD